ncbi:hypothetical protein Q7A_1804 [Methylophaga nitratireducenticrescens]|uniref:TniQ family protein n=1 Tax=Methylophaga nitratireducenticrescens TaxID=754476 RepID=UPI000B7A246B|nr:TniQ family protein [Methylophaga nitratireducenticrescens]AFI84622.2 hypothetical protein Q7A_1804 [Methylophaga nitratireducenticrescens]
MENKYHLPVQCLLLEGESLPGLLSRATHVNSYASMFSIANYFGMETSGNGLTKNHMRMLAKGNVNIEALASFTGEEPLRVKQAALTLRSPMPGTVSDDYISFNSWRFCPSCVREGRPHQRAWLISFVTACPEHQCQLVDSCHACGTTYSTAHMLSRFCLVCHKPANKIIASEQELECTEALMDKIDNVNAIEKLLDRLMLGWLLTSPDCLRPHHRLSPQLKSVSEMRDLIDRLWPYCSDEPTFTQSLANFQNQVVAKWQYLPNLPSAIKERALSAGGKFNNTVPDNENRTFELPVSVWWAPINETARSAGISAFVLKKLIEEKYIASKVFNDTGDDKKQHKFLMVNLDSVNELIGKLIQKAQPYNGKISLTSIKHYPIEEIVHGVLSEKLPIYFKGKNLINQLYVLNIDTEKAKRKELRPDDALTVKEAGEVLHTYHSVVVDLINHGFLLEHDSSGSRRLLIKRDSLDRFKDKFIVIGSIAEELGENATNLAEKLAAVGITPQPDNTLVKIYLKKKLKDLDIQRIKSMASYDTKTGRKPSYNQENVSSLRVKNLILLIDKHGGITDFTRKFGGSEGTLSMMLRERKSFGNLAVRRMEKKVGLPEGWFDSRNNDSSKFK